MMDLRIFEPYFINYLTIVEYQKNTQSLSINDILKSYTKSMKKKQSSRLFFKVNLNDSVVSFQMLNL